MGEPEQLRHEPCGLYWRECLHCGQKIWRAGETDRWAGETGIACPASVVEHDDDDDDAERLPEWLEKNITNQLREGIALSIDWKGPPSLDVTAIHWHPGDPNPLAGAIIKYCEGPLELELNGHEYTITPREK